MAKDKKILIVDDSEADRTALKTILHEDFKVLEANSGFSALEIMAARKSELDAVLLDVSMPVMDGFAVLQNMKDKKLNNLHVFMVTSEATKENVKKAVQFYNIADFIKKPYERDDVLQRVRSKLGIASEVED